MNKALQFRKPGANAVVFNSPSGTCTISKDVIQDITGYAVADCYGVTGMVWGSTVKSIAGAVAGRGTEKLSKGIGVRVDDNELVIDIHIQVLYGVNLRAVTDSIVEKVSYGVQNATGVPVKAVNVFVDSMKSE